MSDSRIVLFGGTFDPIHTGHIQVITEASKVIGADKTILIPARRSPFKDYNPIASDADRLAIASLAISDRPNFLVSDFELSNIPPSYTIDTIRHFSILYPDSQLYWVCGADVVDDLSHWHQVEQLLKLCRLSVMFRGGFVSPDFEFLLPRFGRKIVDQLTSDILEVSLVDISSTMIRTKLKRGESVDSLLSPAVVSYILQHHLYQ